MQNFLKGVEHVIATFIIFAAPVLLMGSTGWKEITLGSLLAGAYAWARAYATS